MRSRLAAVTVVLAAAGALSGCGGSGGSGDGAPAATRPASAQLAAQALLLKEFWNPSGDCGCTAEARAKERVADGRAEAPPPDGEVLQP